MTKRLEERHWFVVGNSGTGKSTLMSQMFSEYDHGPSIHVEHVGADHYQGRPVRNFEQLDNQLKHYDRWEDVKLVFHTTEWSLTEAFYYAIDFARDVMDMATVATQITIDEVHNAVPHAEDAKVDEEDPNYVYWCLHEGRKHGVKIGMATQHPQQLKSMYMSLAQLKYWGWVGPPAGVHGSFLTHPIASWIPVDRIRKLDRFEYIVFDDEGNLRWEGETNPQFGESL